MLEKAKKPEFMELLRRDEKYTWFRETVHEKWREYGEKDVPMLTYGMFQAFFETGSRQIFGEGFFLRRRQLGSSAWMALLYPEDERYFKKLLDVIWAILDEYTWTPPEHIQFCVGAPEQDIDLFASETAQQLAEISELFGDRLPETVRQRIDRELEHRTVQGYLHNTYLWENVENNWAMVCLCGVVSVILHLHPEMIDGLLPRILSTVRTYVGTYQQDGVCIEGLGYWNYGMSKYAVMTDLILEHTGGRVDLFAEMGNGEKRRNMLTFNRHMSLGHGLSVSFDDVGMAVANNAYLLYYLRRRYPEIVTFSKEDNLFTQSNCDLFSTVLREAMWYMPTPEKAADASYEECHMAETGWFVKTTPRYGFAAKGGRHEKPYHADLGAFMLASDGVRFITDPGAGEYTKDYFAKRYANFHVSSRGHSVPIVDGQYQVGEETRTAETRFENGVFSIDLSNAYPADDLTMRRKFTFGEDRVVLEDRWAFAERDKSVTERFVTMIKPEITEDGVRIGSVLLRADTENVHITEEHPGREATYYCIDYDPAPGAQSFRMEMFVGEGK